METRAAFVTGGGRNIGRATCLTLADRGFDVVVNGASNRAACEAVAGEVRAKGRRAFVVMGDVGRREEANRMAAEALAAAGRIDVLVANAAIRPRTPFLETTEEEWRRVLATDLDGAFFLSQAFLPGMIARKWGRLVFLTGRHAIRGSSGVSVTVAKNGLWGLTKVLGREFGDRGVTVNAVSPGAIATTRDTAIQRAHAEVFSASAKEIPRGTMGEPEEIAATVGFLCADEAAFINGQMIGVNGGVET